MSGFAVTVEKLTIFPHPNADALELAQVGLYRAVVGKGIYQTGDYALYIPEQAVLPDELIEELGLTGRLAGSKKNRVKAVRLRGELSQGIVCRPKRYWESLPAAAAEQHHTDFSSDLGIIKWVPDIPVSMAGQVIDGTDMVKWIDIENIKRYPNVFEPGEMVFATEKIHGTCCLVTYVRDTDTLYVSSKGYAEKHLSIQYNRDNLYWRAVDGHDLGDFAKHIMSQLNVDKIGIFGEVYGQGVQDLTYGAVAKKEGSVPGFAIFDIAIENEGEKAWMSRSALDIFVRGFRLATGKKVDLVPLYWIGEYKEEVILGLASGRETVSGDETHIREGVVIRPMQERHSDVLGGRAILKVISDDYLTRKGGTEYQ